MNLRLTSIQRFSTYDGPGIRTTLFTKGCSIRCPWCSNPENMNYEIQDYVTDSGIVKQYGKDYSVSEVFEICMRDKDFYDIEGGVTASGGEALLQATALSELFSLLKSNSITCGMETSLYASEGTLRAVLRYLDFIYVDMKILNPTRAKELLKADYKLYISNLDYLFKNFDRNNITIRIPIVKEFTDTEDNLKECRVLLEKYKPGCCEIFSVHNLGAAKYRTLGKEYKEFNVYDAENLEEYRQRLAVEGIKVTVKRL